jgi:creatinine amidohydrolase
MKTLHYDELTYPQVAALPRSVPLVIPLGGPPDTGALARKLQRKLGRVPRQVVMLPPLPSEWNVPPAILRRFLATLTASLMAQGFRQISNIKSQTPVMRIGASVSNLESEIENPKSKIVLMAVGHTEQHGHHLPLATDTLIIDAISRGVKEALPEVILRVPTLPYGVSMHRAQFPGTVTVEGRAWEDFVLESVGWFVERGFDKLYLINGHGGNNSFLVNAVKYAGNRWPHIFCATSLLHLTASGYSEIQRLRESVFPGGMGHACELETSYLLHLRPDLVHMERAVDEIDFIATPEYYMDWLEGGALIANPPWTDDTLTGAYGQPSVATAEKGRAWLAAAITEKVGHVHEIMEQQDRRIARRAQISNGLPVGVPSGHAGSEIESCGGQRSYDHQAAGLG